VRVTLAKAMTSHVGGVAVAAALLLSCGSSASSHHGGAGEAGVAEQGGHGGVGGGADNSAAGNTVSGGAASSGSASGGVGGSVGGGDQAGSATQGGSPAGGQAPSNDADPLPVEPDLTGLVPTSNQWLLLTLPLKTGVSNTSDIELLDLATDELHAANAGGPIDALGGVSPDGRTYFFSDGDGLRVSARVIRLGPTGFVPSQPLADYKDVTGAMRVVSWSVDSRFAVVSRGAAPSSIEIVDMLLGKRLHSENLSGHVGAFAPVGYRYFYDAATTDAYQPRYARITAAGSTEPKLLPPDADYMAFDQSANWLFYVLGYVPGKPPVPSLHAVSLNDDQNHDITLAGAGESFEHPLFFPAPGDSVVAAITTAADSTSSYRRVFFADANKAPVTLSGAAASLGEEHAADGNVLIVRYYPADTLDLIRVEPYARRALPGSYVTSNNYATYGVVGTHAYYVSTDGLHVASLSDAGELTDTVVSSPGKEARPCAWRSTIYTPQNKLAFVEGGSERLVFVDLTSDPPAVVGSITPSAGYGVVCPIWGDADTAVAVTEFKDGTSLRNAWVMRWKVPNAPDAAKLVAQGVLGVHAVMFR